jgi:hypothetical protein
MTFFDMAKGDVFFPLQSGHNALPGAIGHSNALTIVMAHGFYMSGFVEVELQTFGSDIRMIE